MRLPNLVIAGFPRCGTTWLYRILGERPEIFVPYRKELHYFDRNVSRGLEWYGGYFADAGESRWRLDVTPEYAQLPDIGRRLVRTLPGVRVVVVVRDPVERLHSEHLLYYRTRPGHARLEEKIRDESFLWRSLYHAKVRSLLEALGEDSLKVLVYEDSLRDPRAYLDELWGFLGLHRPDGEEWPTGSVGGRVNRTLRVPSLRLHRLLHTFHRAGRHRQVEWLDRMLDRGRDLYYRWLPGSTRGVDVDEPTRRRLEAYYREDVERMSELLGRDLLSLWGFARRSGAKDP